MNAPMPKKVSLAQRMVERFGVDQDKIFHTLKATAFKVRDGSVSDEQMTALLVVADQYGLNPWTKELYAYPDKQNGIVPVVSVDGWTRIINGNPMLDGIEFRYSDKMTTPSGGKPAPEWCEVVITRKDREKPIVIREYLDEVYRPPFRGKKDGREFEVGGPWQSHTKRMLRHKTLIQGARTAFGFAGIYDEDEAQRIVERDVTAEGETLPSTPAPKQIEYYPQGKFDELLPTWSTYISSGKKTAEEIITMAEMRNPLTDEQKKKVRAVAVQTETTGEVDETTNS